MKPAAQRKAVEHARQLFGISERRACTIFGVDRTSVRYAPRRSDDGDLRSRLREIAAERRRFGYRRLGIMLAREGLARLIQRWGFEGWREWRKPLACCRKLDV